MKCYKLYFERGRQKTCVYNVHVLMRINRNEIRN